MDLTPYVDSLREELAVVAEAGGTDARAIAERLTAPLESAIRLMLLEALSVAAGEITRELAPGSVDVRLRGREPEFIVTSPPSDEDGASVVRPTAPTAASAVEVEEGAVSRINFRVPEHLKIRIEEAAGRDGLSVNAWLVRLTAAALEHGDGDRRPSPRRSGVQRLSGWVR